MKNTKLETTSSGVLGRDSRLFTTKIDSQTDTLIIPLYSITSFLVGGRSLAIPFLLFAAIKMWVRDLEGNNHVIYLIPLPQDSPVHIPSHQHLHII